jgi:hypothetical protein
MYAKESDIYASTFRSEPLIDKPSGSTTPGRQALPPIDYKEHSEERMTIVIRLEDFILCQPLMVLKLFEY